MKIKNISRTRKAQPYEFAGYTFYIKPITASLQVRFSALAKNTGNIYPKQLKIEFCDDCLDDWSDVVDENDNPIEFSKQSARDVLCDDDNEMLFSILFSASQLMAMQSANELEEDIKQAKKP